jgi:arylsulfate sulfotransferase
MNKLDAKLGYWIGALLFLGVLTGCGSGGNGTVTATTNPQVALYTITPSSAGTVTVNFGTTTSYGLKTYSVPTPIGGGPVNIEVAGMLANTTYHMQAVVKYQDGTTAHDVDHTFTTSQYPASSIPPLTVTTTGGQTPQPGVEMLNPTAPPAGQAEILVTDLAGHVLWEYNSTTPTPNGASWLAPKQLPNGDYIAILSPLSSQAYATPISANAANLVREFDLIGNTVKQITMAQLNAEMTAANYNIPLIAFSHDVTVMPNGHWLVDATTVKSVTLTGATSPTNVLGDVIIDLDTNLKPVWVWNEFDHLDVNRHPVSEQDWTHTNAILYSPSDGDILVSMRHQSWVVKVDYNNGAGTGNIIWHLGYEGDFTLAGGTAPTDWFSGQHGPAFTTTNTDGIFGLTLMDNGDFRTFAPGVNCGAAGAPPCHYSSVPILQINETAKTATFEFLQKLPASLYNSFGGNAEQLANGDIEYDLCGLGGPSSQVFEVTDDASNPQTVWNMKVTSEYLYRAFRMPSLYPGVQW